MHRLEGLMWSDWHSDVRSAAAQALASTGHGLVVHDSVLDRMCDSSHIVRCDALRRLGQLGSSIQLESVILCLQPARYNIEEDNDEIYYTHSVSIEVESEIS